MRKSALLILCITLSTIGVYGQKKSQDKTPNIIYIYADDLGYGELGCYGQKKIKTPNIDKMAAEGMRFTQHYSGAPVCAPSRCMLLSGKHAGHTYIRGNYELGGYTDETEGGQMPLPETLYTVASMLKERGYTTGGIGKWGLGAANTSGDPSLHGFDYFFGYMDQKQAHNYYPTHLWENGKYYPLNNSYFSSHQKIDSAPTDLSFYDRYKGKEYAPEVMTEKAINFIKNNKDKPFFLYLPYTIPHLALQVPDTALEQYKGKFDEKAYLGDKGYLPHPFPLSAYAGMISTLDSYVGRIMALLKQLELDEETLVMFSSDNGPTFTGGTNKEFFESSSGLRGGKMEVYEGGIRIPFIARWPGKIKAGTESNHISVQYDLLPTLAELTKATAYSNDGISFLPSLSGKLKQKEHPFLYFEYPENNGQIALRIGDWKGVKTNMKKEKSPWQLFNLSTDRNETTDVAHQHPEILNQLDEIVLREHRHSHIKEWEFVDPKFD